MEHSTSRIIREKECRNVTGLSRQYRWTLEQEGKFPKRVPLGPKAIGWVEAEVQDWLAAQMAQRDVS